LRRHKFGLSLLSGDRAAAGIALARNIGIDHALFGLTPEQKLAALDKLAAKGKMILMVGDGLNDAPALRAAHAAMAPASAADIGRNAADFIYTRNNLSAVPFTLDIARRAAIAVKQNFGLAIAYNCVAVPLAVSGQVTPLIAAIAMSSSSIVVTLNALRLRFGSNITTAEPIQSPKDIDRQQIVIAQ
jgi:Cu2+-exporting ATPase